MRQRKYTFANLFFLVFFNALQGSILYHSNLHMNELSNDIVSTAKQLLHDTLLCFITLNAKTRTCELNSDSNNKSE